MKTCFECEHCLYIGEGDSICTYCEEPKIVLDDWAPTEYFGTCNHK